MDVTIAGTIGCAMFPYSCTVTLSVVEPGTRPPVEWRPAATDASWWPDWSAGGGETAWPSTKRLSPTVHGRLPSLNLGAHTLVVAILGSDDTPDVNPDGSVATDLLGRCQTDVAIDSSAIRLLVTVSLTPGRGFDTTCSIGTKAVAAW